VKEAADHEEKNEKNLKKVGLDQDQAATSGSGSSEGSRSKQPSVTGIPKVAPHDLRRSCARLCHSTGGELEQIQFLLGHVSVQTTERYLGCKQRLKEAVNDQIGIEPEQ
jgi:integrase